MTTSLDSSSAASAVVEATAAAVEAEMEDVKPSVDQLQELHEQQHQQQQQQQQPTAEDDNNNSGNNNSSSSDIGINRLMKIKKLRAKLVNEEHRLVLMKKIRQSQTRPIQQQQTSGGSSAATNSSTLNASGPNNLSMTSGVNSSSSNSSFNNNAGHLRKPTSIRQSQLSSSSLTNSSALPLHKNHLSSLGGSQNALNNSTNDSLNQTPAHAHQRPKVNTLWNPPQQARHPTPAGIAPPHVGNLSRQPITTPPNVVQAMMGSLTGPQSLLMSSIANAAQTTSSSRRSAQQPQANKLQTSQMLMQKRSSSSSSASSSAFKPTLQKQLEQTLLQQQQRDQHKYNIGQGLNFTPSPSNKRGSGIGGISSPHVGNPLSRQPITTPPNVVQDMRANLAAATGQQSLLMSANNLSSSPASSLARQQSQQQGSQSPFNKSQATQLLIQRRNAAKTAIQKQLEQNLMQLPQKQIQVAIDFIPNANNIEFVYYIGLEACVDYLTDTKNPLDVEPLEKPLECSTCGTDFTPSWSWKRSNAVCENCVSNHVKKSIKNSQANRIKSALAKAVKQESEMDQRIMAEAANVVSSPSSPATGTNNHHHQQQQHSLLQQPTSQHQQRHTHQRNNSIQDAVAAWNRANPEPRTTTSSSRNSNNIGRISNSSNVQPAVPPNPLAGLQPAALLSLLQMNPQLNALASLMNPTAPPVVPPAQTQPRAAAAPLNNSTNNNNTNQFAQVAALLMNQLTTNLWRR